MRPAIFFLAIIFLSSCSPAAPVSLSEDQQELVERYGYPDTFIVMMQDETRIETWTYYPVERNFIFFNGEFAEDEYIPELSEAFEYPQFRPTQFKAGMNLDEVKQILGEPSAVGEISEDVLPGITIYDFHDQVKVGLNNNEVVYVQTLPVAVKK